MRHVLLSLLLVCCTSAFGRVPVLYSTDLFHPPDDPDDHYDLATLFSLPELDVRGIVIDMVNIRQIQRGQEEGKGPGLPAIHQMFHLSGRRIPCATGLQHNLSSPKDTGREQAADTQGAVELILATLRDSKEKVAIFATGSLADVAAAYNREPDLFREKLRTLYVNAGNGPDGWQDEWNVRLDPHAYRAIMESGLPMAWYPCFGRDGCGTYFRVEQAGTLAGCIPELRAFFVYALNNVRTDPIAYLSTTPPPPRGPRNMWCTPAFFDLAGRKVYHTERGYEVLAQPPRTDAQPVQSHTMVPVQLAVSMQAPESATAGLRARYLGCEADRIGRHALSPDGASDCRVCIDGLPAGAEIAAATLHGPRDGTWVSREDQRWWRIQVQHEGDLLVADFSYWDSGMHRLELEMSDATTRSIEFHVSAPDSPHFTADFDVRESNIRVFRQSDDYGEIMGSCLRNLLASFPRNRR